MSDRKNSNLYAVVVHATWAVWLVFRVAAPCYLMYGLYRYVIPYHHNLSCYIITYITGTKATPLTTMNATLTGHVIFLFCLFVFCGMVTPSLYRWYFPPSPDVETIPKTDSHLLESSVRIETGEDASRQQEGVMLEMWLAAKEGLQDSLMEALDTASALAENRPNKVISSRANREHRSVSLYGGLHKFARRVVC